MEKTTRVKRILEKIDLSRGQGLEIGPLANPIVAKSQASIYYLDHENQQELRWKYKNEPIELDNIVKVDYVLHEKTLPKTIGNKKFDYIIASHVIEHIPNMVGWLSDIASIIKPGGILSLVIPDKRFTFDINRRISSPADVMGAYLDKLQRFSSTMIYDFANCCTVDVNPALVWNNPSAYANTPKRWSLKEVNEKCERHLRGEYVDCHCFVLTPASFIEILRTLIEQGLLDFEVVYFLETQKNEQEFYVSLSKIDRKKISTKKQLSSLPEISFTYNKEESLNKQVEQLKQEIYAITHSVSWRSTRYIRALRKLF